jgi:DNA repair exonuclease SbcCD ATPase subunit
LKESLGAGEVTYKLEHIIDPQVVRTSASTMTKTDLRSPDAIGRLLKEYYAAVDMPDEDMDAIVDQAKVYLTSAASSEDLARGAKWSLLHLKWDNLFNYGTENSIDFQKLGGVVGLFGLNRVGKSSLVGSIMYSLFNSTDRGPVKNLHVCNSRKAKCYSQAIIDYSGKTYVVERKTSKSTNKKGIISATTTLGLYGIGENNEVTDLCGEQRTDTEKTLRAMLGTGEDFLMTSVTAQGDVNSQFINLGPTKRSAVLAKYLDLDVFDKMHDIASKEVNGLKGQLKSYQDRDWRALSDKNKEDVASAKSDMESAAAKIADTQAELNTLRSIVEKLDMSTVVTPVDVARQTEKVEKLKKKILSSEEALCTFLSSIDYIKQKLSDIEIAVNSVDIEALKAKLSLNRSLDALVVELHHAHAREDLLHKSQQKSLKILSDVPCGDDYPTCKFIKDAHVAKSSIDEQSRNVKKTLKMLEEAQARASAAATEDVQRRLDDITAMSSRMSQFRLEISQKETVVEKTRSSIAFDKEALSGEITTLEQMEDSLKNSENVEAVSTRRILDELTANVACWDADRISAASRHGRACAISEKLVEEKSARDSLLKDLKIREMIVSAFSKKGIPLTVIKSQLPIINAEVSKILSGIENFTIQVENDDETDALEIYIDYGDSRRLVELCSGMEKTIASIALRVAMVNVSTMPKSDIFIIDEGFGTLDPASVESCNRLLISLKKHFKTILVITHVDGIKDIVDHIVEISKEEKDAKVVYP